MKPRILIIIFIITILIVTSFPLSTASENETNLSIFKNGTRDIERRPLGSVYGMRGAIASPDPNLSSTQEPTTTPPTTTTAPTTIAPTTTTAPTITQPTTKPAPTTAPPTATPSPSKGVCGPTVILLLTLTSALGVNAREKMKIMT